MVDRLYTPVVNALWGFTIVCNGTGC